MDARSEPGRTAPPSVSVGRWKSLIPLRFTISQMMFLTFVVGLALTPLAMVRNHDRIELIVAMVGFEVIGLPALITLVLLLTMKPGPQRLKTILFLSLVPTLLIAATVGLSYLVSFPFFLITVVTEAAAGNFRHLPNLGILVYGLIFLKLAGFLDRCPTCQTRRLRLMKSPPPTSRKWLVVYECKGCGWVACRNAFHIFAQPQGLNASQETRPG